MKKAMRLFLALVLVCCTLFAVPLCASAESNGTKDGLEVTVTTEKDVFFAEEDIKLNVSIKNTNTYIVEAVDVETVLPAGLTAKTESVNAEDVNIEAGATYSMELVLQANGKNSGDGKGMPVWIWFIIGGVALLIIGAVVALVFANKRKNKNTTTKVLSLLLCFTMVLAIAPIGANAEGEEETPALTTITVDKAITAKDTDYTIKWNISCPQENSAPTCTVTFNSNGGKDVEVLSVNKGEVPQMPTPEKDDHFFVGWYTDAELSTLFEYDAPMYRSCQVYARWIDFSNTTDTDGEGLYDVLEDFYGTDKNAEDTDGDGLNDYIEINQFGYDPVKADTDGNGVNDADEDYDGDKLKNKAEMDVGTDPVLADTDADGLDDNAELNTHKTDANKKDTDGDGVSDGKEVEIGTNPLVAEGSFDLDYSAKENGDSVKASVKIQLNGDQVDSLKIEPISDDVYFPTTIPGYMGKAYDFSVDGSFDSAVISFDYDLGNADPFTAQPTIYYFNEKTQELEALETTVENGIASATVTHFSTYILIDRTVYEESFTWTDVWDSDNMFTAVEVVLVIDDSGSMDWNDENNSRLSVAKTLIDKLPKDSLIGITKFSSYTTKLTATLISDKEAAKAYLTTNHFNSSGGTAMYTAINDSFALFTATEETTLKMMVVLSDGESDGTYKHADTVTAANDKNIRIYTVGLGSSSESYFNNYLKPLAVNTGAAFYYASNADQLSEIYEDINEKIDIETDSDGDGIPDYYEENLPMFNGTTLKMDKNSADSDGDTIPDNKELELKYIYNDDKTQVKVIGKLVLGHPALKDTDNDGIDDNEDEEPFVFGLKDGVVGTLMLVSSHQGGVSNGHAYLAFTSYVKFDFSVSGTYCYIDEESGKSIRSRIDSIEMKPNDLFTFGLFATTNNLQVILDSFSGPQNGQSCTGTTEGGLFINNEMLQEESSGEMIYSPRAAIYEYITLEQLLVLSSYLSNNDYYGVRTHNCSSLASSAWNMISNRKVKARGKDGLTKYYDTPMVLKESIEQYEEITNSNYFIEYK